MNTTLTARPRYHILDTVRGICIILVVLYHLLYDLSEVFGGHYAFFRSHGMDVFRDHFVGVLIVLAGISCNLTRSDLKRGVKTVLCGILVAAVMSVAMPGSNIVFGILHFLGTGMILHGLSRKVLAKIPMAVGIPVSLILFLLTLGISEGSFGWPGVFTLEIPTLPKNTLLYILGFDTGHDSADHWPVMPWMFLFLTGTFLGRLFKDDKVPRWFRSDPVPPLSFLGRHTLIIYLVHQPLIYGTLYLLDRAGLI